MREVEAVQAWTDERDGILSPWCVPERYRGPCVPVRVVREEDLRLVAAVLRAVDVWFAGIDGTEPTYMPEHELMRAWRAFERGGKHD